MGRLCQEARNREEPVFRSLICFGGNPPDELLLSEGCSDGVDRATHDARSLCRAHRRRRASSGTGDAWSELLRRVAVAPSSFADANGDASLTPRRLFGEWAA